MKKPKEAVASSETNEGAVARAKPVATKRKATKRLLVELPAKPPKSSIRKASPAPTSEVVGRTGRKSPPPSSASIDPSSGAAASNDLPTTAAAEDEPGSHVAREPKEVSPDTLKLHPYYTRWFDGDAAREASLVDAFKTVGVARPLIVAGNDCPSARGTVLAGSSCVEPAKRTQTRVEVLYRDGLSTDQEEAIVVADLLESQLVPKMTPRRAAEFEHLLRTKYAGRIGRPRQNAADISGVPVKGDARGLIAKEVGSTRNAVEDRRVIFYAAASPIRAQDDVDKGALKPSRAAAAIRTAEQQPEVKAALARATADGLSDEVVRDLPAVRVARARVEQELYGTQPFKATSTGEVTATVDEVAGVSVAEVTVDAGVYRVEIGAGTLRMIRLRPKPRVTSDFAWPLDPTTEPVTSGNWHAVVKHVVEQLPDDTRGDLEVGPIESVASRTCITCGSSWFYYSGACCSCSVEDEGLRHNLRHGYRQAAVRRGGKPVITLTEWRSGLDAGITGGAQIDEMDRPVLLPPDGFMYLDEKRNRCPHASVAGLAGRLAALLATSEGSR